jgi:hypothetical protein
VVNRRGPRVLVEQVRQVVFDHSWYRVSCRCVAIWRDGSTDQRVPSGKLGNKICLARFPVGNRGGHGYHLGHVIQVLLNPPPGLRPQPMFATYLRPPGVAGLLTRYSHWEIEPRELPPRFPLGNRSAQHDVLGSVTQVAFAS